MKTAVTLMLILATLMVFTVGCGSGDNDDPQRFIITDSSRIGGGTWLVTVCDTETNQEYLTRYEGGIIALGTTCRVRLLSQ